MGIRDERGSLRWFYENAMLRAPIRLNPAIERNSWDGHSVGLPIPAMKLGIPWLGPKLRSGRSNAKIRQRYRLRRRNAHTRARV